MELYHILYRTLYQFVNILLILIFVQNSSLLSETYIELRDMTWKYGEKCMDIADDNVDNKLCLNNNRYNYFLQYIAKYPLTITFTKVTVTRINFFKFVLAFAVAKFISFLVKRLYT